MGHLVNPISFRLGLNRSWNSVWSSNNFINYAYLIQRDLFIYNFIKTLFLQKFLLTNGILYSHSRIINLINGRCKIINYIYNQWMFKKMKFLVVFLRVAVKKHSSVLKFLKKSSIIHIKLNSTSNIELFAKKLCIFICYYLLKIIYLKPINYLFKILNIIIKRWLIMIDPHFVKYQISYNFLSNYQVTPHIVSLYIATKLKQRHMLFKVVKPVFKDLEANPFIFGYKICCSGRFTRKQRATYYWVKKGLIPFNRINSMIDYSYKSQVLPFGICGIKVWLCRKLFIDKNHNDISAKKC